MGNDAARRHCRRFDPVFAIGIRVERATDVHGVEVAADDVNPRFVVGLSVVKPDLLSHPDLEGVIARQRSDLPVRNDELRILVGDSFDRVDVPAGVILRWLRVEVAFHHIEMLVDRRKAPSGQNDYRPVRSRGHVQRNRRYGAVVDEGAHFQRLEPERDLLPWADGGNAAAAEGAGCRVKTDVVGVPGLRRVLYRDLDPVARA